MMLSRSRDLDRLLTFIDAIVAIAITLLILPLVDVANEHGGSASEILSDNLGQLGAFALSFLVILRFWWAQHRVLGNVIDDDRLFDCALVAWAFTIVFLPFPTELAASSSDDVPTRLLYIGTMAASAVALSVLTYSLKRNPALTDGPAHPMTPSVVVSVLFIIALILSAVVYPIGYLSLFVLFLAGPIDSFVERRRAGGAGVGTPAPPGDVT